MPIYKDFRYTEKEDYIIIRAYCGEDINVVVPETIKGKPVQEISPFAFVPEMDEIEIANNDFKKRCSQRVRSIQLPDTILRLDFAFACCFELEEIRIPHRAEFVGDIFKQCYLLKTISVDENNPHYSSRNGILYSKDGKKLFRCPPGHPCNSTDILDGVVEIGESAFEFCANLVSIIIPETVTVIESIAFANCHNLHYIQLHENIHMIGAAHFWCCKALESIVYYNVDGVVPRNEFYSCAKLQNVDIRSKVRIIGDGAFSSDVSLENFIVPKGTTAINGSAFMGCRSLNVISLPRSVSRIHNRAFSGCGNRYYSAEEMKDIRTSFGQKPKTTFVVIPGSKAEKFCIEQDYSILYPQINGAAPNWSAITESELKDIDYLVNAFGRYLKKECEYSAEQAKFTKDVIDDPYSYKAVHKQFEGKAKICGTEYEIFFCAINDCGAKKFFTFYMLIDTETIKEEYNKERAYVFSKKKYLPIK